MSAASSHFGIRSISTRSHLLFTVWNDWKDCRRSSWQFKIDQEINAGLCVRQLHLDTRENGNSTRSANPTSFITES